MPWLTNATLSDCFLGCSSQPKKGLIQFWMETSSQIMCLDHNNNPLSFPLIQHIVSNPSLLHAVQSLSAGYEVFFEDSKLETCLEERGRAIKAISDEFKAGNTFQPSTVLTVLLLGVSSVWTEAEPHGYGKEHIYGARAMLDLILKDERTRKYHFTRYVLGWYLYWDMSCSFIADPHNLLPLDTPEVLEVLHEMQTSFHPMTGFSTELFYVIACPRRHCRRVIEFGERDALLEASFEQSLLAWNPVYEDQHLVQLSCAYRNHGLIMLYQICGSSLLSPSSTSTTIPTIDAPALIRMYALETVECMLAVPINAAGFNFHSIPLLTAGAELLAEHEPLRTYVVTRFEAIYSSNRVKVNIWAIELLQEIWSCRDCGVDTTWVHMMMQKQWRLSFS